MFLWILKHACLQIKQFQCSLIASCEFGFGQVLHGPNDHNHHQQNNSCDLTQLHESIKQVVRREHVDVASLHSSLFLHSRLECCKKQMLDEIAQPHYNDVIMSMLESQTTCVSIVYSVVVSGDDQRKHQSSTSLASVCGIHQWPLNSLHKGTITWKMFAFDDVIMLSLWYVEK